MSTLRVDAIRHNSATSDAITMASDGTCTAKITSVNGGSQLSHRNIIVNGAMTIAQRGSSSTSNGYHTVDRFQVNNSATDEAPTQAHVDVASGTTPYSLGFRKALKVTNGNQTSGAGASDFIRTLYYIEAQDLANSGWNYKSSSSYITLSFWVKASVAQTYYTNFRAFDGTQKMYYFSYTLSADTWTKVTHTIPGHADISFDNDTGQGMYIQWYQFRGTNNTGPVTANQWHDLATSTFTPDQDSTWYTTNDATFEITGVQLEVGDTATSFEHRSFGEELRRCQRYFFNITGDNGSRTGIPGYANATNELRCMVQFPVPMRALPTVAGSSTAMVFDSQDDSASFNCSSLVAGGAPTTSNPTQMCIEVSTSGMTNGQGGQLEFRAANGFINFSAEL